MLKLLNPFALWFLFFLIPVFLMYFLKPKPRRIITTTNIFWLEAINHNKTRNVSVWRIFYFLSFLLSVFFVLFLVAAAVEPVYLASENCPKTVITFDNSTYANTKNNNNKTHNNIAITQFQSRLLFADLSSFELFVELSNFGDEVIETRLKIFVDEQVLDVLSVSLQPHEIKSYFINNTIKQSRIFETKNIADKIGVVIRGEIDVDDYFVAGNVAYTILPSPRLQKILYFGDDNFFLINALKSCIPLSQEQTKFERINELPEVVPFDSVLIINRRVPPKLPIGNVMIFDPKNGCDLFGVNGIFPSSLVIGFESGKSQLIKFTQFQGKELSSISKINLPESKNNQTPEILLATAENHPVYLSWNFRNENKSDLILNRILVLAADISQSDIVWQVSFPILINNALNYFCGVSDELGQNYFVGESIILNVENGIDRVKIKSPSGKSKILPVYSDLDSSKRNVYVGKLNEIGIYEIFDVTDKNADSIESENSKNLIKKLACNFNNKENKFTNNLQVHNLNKPSINIPNDKKHFSYNFNNVQFCLLFTFLALLFLISDWQITKIKK